MIKIKIIFFQTTCTVYKFIFVHELHIHTFMHIYIFTSQRDPIKHAHSFKNQHGSPIFDYHSSAFEVSLRVGCSNHYQSARTHDSSMHEL